MTTMTEELAKRYSAAHKASLTKVSGHLRLAKGSHASGMERLAKAAAHMVEAKKLGKAADGDHLAGHIAAAHDHFGKAADHVDDASAHLGSAMGAWGHGNNVDPNTKVGGEINIPSMGEMTEGSVPQYESDAPYGKIAEMVQMAVTKVLTEGGYVPKDKVDQLIKDAGEKAAATAETAGLKNQIESLTKHVELLSRQPSGAPRVKIFDFEKSALPGMGGSGDAKDENRVRLGALMDGVDLNMENEGEFTKAAGRMIGNMIGNGPKFGKNLFGKAPMYDAAFHGRGGTGARN